MTTISGSRSRSRSPKRVAKGSRCGFDLLPMPEFWTGLPEIAPGETARLLGSGAYGQVFLIRNASGTLSVIKQMRRFDPQAICHEIAVLKYLQSIGLEEQCGLQRFEGAFLAPRCAAINGTCVVSDQADLVPSIQIEYVSGAELTDYLQAQIEIGPIDSEIIAETLFQLLKQLLCLHAGGIVHRDVKLENVIVSQDPLQFRLIDYGAACSVEPSSIEQCKPATAGTIGYLAPEVFQGSAQSPASDIWALGIVGWELRHFQRPLIHNHKQADRQSLRAGQVALKPHAEAIDKVIAKLLDYRPSGRPTAAQALVELQKAYPDL